MGKNKVRSNISVSSLGNPDKAGWLTKQGGSVKTWKKRWFVLKGDTLYYFKTQKDTQTTGEIKLLSGHECQLEPSKKKKNCSYFSIITQNRLFLIYSDSESVTRDWVDKIKLVVKKLKEKENPPPVEPKKEEPKTPEPTPAPVVAAEPAKPDPTPAPAEPTPVVKEAEKETASEPSPATPASSEKKDSPRGLISQAKSVIRFLQEEDSKVLEFWQIWSESIPAQDDLQAGMAIEYHVSTSANMEKLTWRTAGPQNIFIQKMVDFFWNVGAPESEIDRLNDVGALINPLKIGSWIDMSADGGMDGGWYFPVQIPLKMAIEAADSGQPSRKVMEWAEAHDVVKCYSVGRDMGAAPPRQTEIRLKVPGETFDEQWVKVEAAYEIFGFPTIPAQAQEVIKSDPKTGLCLSVITSSEGFVRLGLLVPDPTKENVIKLCEVTGATHNELSSFEKALNSKGPAYAEYQYLKEGFGYGVYKEGFDIVFHYSAGEETEHS